MFIQGVQYLEHDPGTLGQLKDFYALFTKIGL